MNTATIHEIGTTKRTRAPKAKSRSARLTKAIRRQTIAAVALGMVTLILTGLSLQHLSSGIVIVTKAPEWEGLALAIGIDLGFIFLELAQMMTNKPTTLKMIKRWTTPAIVGTLVGSAIMNAFAFGMPADGWMVYPAVILGLAIPALIYATTRTTATMWIDR